jgi:hypothetical protein
MTQADDVFKKRANQMQGVSMYGCASYSVERHTTPISSSSLFSTIASKRADNPAMRSWRSHWMNSVACVNGRASRLDASRAVVSEGHRCVGWNA